MGVNMSSGVTFKDEDIVFPSIVCSVAPKITHVRVEYGAVIQTTVESTDATPDIEGPAGYSAVSAMSQVIRTAQSLVLGNSVANQWIAVNGGPGANWNSAQIFPVIVSACRVCSPASHNLRAFRSNT